MQKADSSSLLDDRDAALQSGTSEKRVAMLRRVTHLFLDTANRLSEEAAALSPQSSAALESTSPLAAKPSSGSAPKTGHGKLEIDFLGLSKSSAQRLLRLRQVRELSAGSA